ncbi:15285_t:CDS:1, partial [Funneliformis mosseae]
MDKQQYQNIIQYLANLTYPENCNTSERKQIQRLSIYYIVKNSQLYKPTKKRLKR